MSKLPRKVEAKLEDLYRQQTAAKEELGKPFPQEEELRTKSDRLVELDMELNMEKKRPEEQSRQSSRTGQKPIKERHGTAR